MVHPPRIRLCHVARRTFSTSPTLHHSHVTKDSLRALLRETGQPVAVVTGQSTDPKIPFHGATLSSFTSIAMDPHPLVSFALRIPSRMADALKRKPDSRMALNFLSSSQADIATLFSRPDLHPNPFASVNHSTDKEGIPIISGTLGHLICEHVTSLSLHDLEFLRGEKAVGDLVQANHSSPSSELFVARVIDAREHSEVEEGGEALLPLIYHRRRYTTISPS